MSNGEDSLPVVCPPSRKRLRRAGAMIFGDNDDDEACEGTSNAQSTNLQTDSTLTHSNMTPKGGRPKASDYDATRRAVLNTAISIYHTFLLGQNPFPSVVEEFEWAKESWGLAREHLGLPNAVHDPNLLKLVTHVSFD